MRTIPFLTAFSARDSIQLYMPSTLQYMLSLKIFTIHPDILTDSAKRSAGASNKGGVGKQAIFLALNVNISITVGDTSKVTIV